MSLAFYTADELVRVAQLIEERGSLTSIELAQHEPRIKPSILTEMWRAGWLTRDGRGARNQPYQYKLS